MKYSNICDETCPRVSVVVLNWNQMYLATRCLEALELQTFEDFEVIVVDNGSTEGNPVELKLRFPKIKLVALKANHGFTGGNNIGIRQSCGEFLALLNNDTEVETHWLEVLVDALDTHPDVGFCASTMILHSDRQLLDTAGDYYTIGGAGGKRGHLDTINKRMNNRPLKVFGASAGAAIYRRTMLEDIGLFDHDFVIAQEDIDLSFRAQLRGYQCLYVPEAKVYHHLNASLRKYSHEYVYYGHRNLEYVYLKNMPSSLLLLTFPLHILDVLLSFLFFLLKGRAGSFLQAKWHVLINLRRVLRKRRDIQRERTVSSYDIWQLLEKRWLTLKIASLLKRL